MKLKSRFRTEYNATNEHCSELPTPTANRKAQHRDQFYGNRLVKQNVQAMHKSSTNVINAEMQVATKM